MSAAPLTPLLTAAEVSQLIQVPEATLATWRCVGKGPAFVKLPKCVRYRSEDVLAWLEDNIRHAPKTERRNMALAIPGRRHGVQRCDRLVGYRTQQDRREQMRSERAQGCDGGPDAGRPDQGGTVRGGGGYVS